MTGEYQIPARRETVFAALNDPETLKACIPHCEEFIRNPDGSYAARIGIRVGEDDTTLAGTIHVEGEAPGRIVFRGEGDGGDAGSLRGSAEIHLAEAGEATRLTYALKTHMSGRLAQFGSRLIDTAARRTAETFLGTLAVRVAGAEPTVAAPSLATPTGDAAEETLVHRLEHSVEHAAEEVVEAAEEAEKELEVAAGRGFLGGPYVWGLLVLLAVIIVLAFMR